MNLDRCPLPPDTMLKAFRPYPVFSLSAEITSQVGIQVFNIVSGGRGGMCAAEISGGISGVDFMKAVVVLALAKIFPSTVQNDKKQQHQQVQDKRRQL